MADNTDSVEPVAHGQRAHHADKFVPKLVDKTEKYQSRLDGAKPSGGDKKPAGGYDATPIPKAPPGYTLKITIHRAENLPFADIPSFSSDPYILAVVKTDLQKRHKQDSDLKLRTPTIHRDTNPKWGTVWTIAHVPSSGFNMKCRIYDEDPADHDDRLGNVHVDVDRIDDNWKGFKERKFDVKKRMGSKRAYTFRGCAALVSRNVKMGGEVYISVENLGKSEGDGGRAYTISPLPWSQHYSPLIGMLAGTKDKTEGKNGKKSTERYNFQAIQMQLRGPVPEHLYHRYVEFRPFVAGMFTSHTLKGRILNHALHHQHARIYNYDTSTKYGEFEEPSIEMTKKFLELVRYDQGGRIFTYVITLDGQMRFTETGKEFGIDLLSKHTMHSDVSIYIAFSGEFFVRRLKQSRKDKVDSPDQEDEATPPATAELDEKAEEKKDKHAQTTNEHHDSLSPPPDHHVAPEHDSQSPGSSSPPEQRPRFGFHHRSRSAVSAAPSPAAHAPQTNESEEPSKDPSHYELIIDNDSGTYRPNAQYLTQLRHFLRSNFPGMRIATLDCQKDEELMSKLKGEQRERKKKSGKQVMYMQNSSMSSISSSDEEELERRAGGDGTAAPSGVLKKEWSKIKNFGHEDKDEQPTTSKAAEGSASSNHNGHGNNMSISTDRRSFDTASEHGRDHFVTPKPSLGDGGLKAFEQEERPLSRDINQELEKRGLEQLGQENQQSIENKKPNGNISASTAMHSVHQNVTTST